MSERGVGPYVKDVVVLVMIDDGDSGISTGRHETEVVTWGFSSRDEMLHVHVHGHRVCVWIHLPWEVVFGWWVPLSFYHERLHVVYFNTQDFAAESMANIITMSSQVLV